MRTLKKHIGIILLLILSCICVTYFGTCKKGFHEDEYYSYYSTNYTDGWAVGDGSWVYPQRYYQEFVVLPGEEFQYDVVKEVQSWDVHPPMYYWVLHTVCSLSVNIFSKWQGLIVNIFFYLLSIVLLYMTCNELSKNRHSIMALLITAGYAFCPAVLSGAMFIRMYTMVSCLVVSALYLHVRGWQRGRLISWRLILLIMANVYVGALTHYYYLIFQFFLSLAMCLALLIKEKHIKGALIYGSSILVSLGLAVLTFPKAIWQLFSGYRGTEATDSFFTASNTWERLCTFGGIFWKYLFSSHWLGLVIVLCSIVLICMRVRAHAMGAGRWIVFLVLIFAGYFFTVAKTALMLGDDAVRYFIPIVSVVYLLFYLLCEWVLEGERWIQGIAALGVTGLLLSDATCLAHGNVLFLYPEEEANIAYAREHSSIPVMYIFQKNNSWRFLANADELFQYQLLYFISDASTDNFTDEYVCNCDELMVYVTNEYGTEEQLERLQRSNPKLSQYELVEESKYCNVYYFYGRQ